MSTNLSLVFNFSNSHETKKIYQFKPKYFKNNLTEADVKKVMEEIINLKNLFSVNVNDKVFNPYEQIHSAYYDKKERNYIIEPTK